MYVIIYSSPLISNLSTPHQRDGESKGSGAIYQSLQFIHGKPNLSFCRRHDWLCISNPERVPLPTSQRLYIVGRNDANLFQIIDNLEDVNQHAAYMPIKCEISMLENVDSACEEFSVKEQSLDLLLMCSGYFEPYKVGTKTPNC